MFGRRSEPAVGSLLDIFLCDVKELINPKSSLVVGPPIQCSLGFFFFE